MNIKNKTFDSSILDQFLEVELPSEQNFLIIKETLTRMGVTPKNKKILYQSCHILNTNSKFYIVHFKELFLLEGKESSLEEIDIFRRNEIAKLLEDWNLLRIKNPDKFPTEDKYIKLIKIVSANDRHFNDWKLVPKYHLKFRD